MTTKTNETKKTLNDETSAFIICDNDIIASVYTRLNDKTRVKFAYVTTYDSIADKDRLVNARSAYISRAKKWQKLYDTRTLKAHFTTAVELDHDDTAFVIV